MGEARSFAGIPFGGPLEDFVCANGKLRNYRYHVKRALDGA